MSNWHHVLAVGHLHGASEAAAVLQKKVHAAEQDRPDVPERRAARRIEQLGFHPRQLVFIDETWAKMNMTRLRGRVPCGQRLVEKVPHGHWKTSTVIAALDHRGMRRATTVDGPVNAQVFTAFVEQVLAPDTAAIAMNEQKMLWLPAACRLFRLWKQNLSRQNIRPVYGNERIDTAVISPLPPAAGNRPGSRAAAA